MVPSATFLLVSIVALLAAGSTAVTSHSSTEESSTKYSTESPSSTKLSTSSTTKRSVTEDLEDTLVSGFFKPKPSEDDEDDEDIDTDLPTLLPTKLLPPREDAQESGDDWGPPSKPAISTVGPGFLIIRIIETVRQKDKPASVNNQHTFMPFQLMMGNHQMPSTPIPTDIFMPFHLMGNHHMPSTPIPTDSYMPFHLMGNHHNMPSRPIPTEVAALEDDGSSSSEENDSVGEGHKNVKELKKVGELLLKLRQMSLQNNKDDEPQRNAEDLTAASFVHSAYTFPPQVWGRDYNSRPSPAIRPSYRNW